MKQSISITMALLVLLCTIFLPVAATELAQTVEYMEDGSYIVTTIEEIDTHGARMSTKVGSKTRSYYNADHILQWKMTVTGEFLFDGTTVSCTYASGVTTVIKTDIWSVTNESATTGANTAFYNVTFSRRALGVIIDRPSYGVSLSCDANGNLS